MRTNDEIVTELKGLALSQKFAASSFKAIRALSHVQLGWFNWETKQHEISIELHEQVALLSLIGDVALNASAPEVHAHVTVARRDGSAYGGHLLNAMVRPTCELILTESPQYLQKRFDSESGLALIRI
jgi:predicted DNA-binding protein with PD1-like motif